MDRKTASTLFSIILFASFFMPFFTWQSFELNGFNFILSEHTPGYKYFLVIIPLLALMRMFGAIIGEDLLFIRKLLTWIPLMILGFLFIVIWIKGNSGNTVFESGDVFSNAGIGFWAALGLSILLVFDKSRLQHHP